MANLSDMAKAVQKKKIENNYLNSVVDEKMYNQLKKAKGIIDESYDCFEKYKNANKKFNYLYCVLLLVGLAIIMFIIQMFCKNNLIAAILMFVCFVIMIIIYEIFIYKPYKNKIRLVDEEEIKGFKIIIDNKNILSILDMKYWFPLAIDYILNLAKENKNMLYKNILDLTDKYLEGNAIKVDYKNYNTADVKKYNWYEMEYKKYQTMEEQNVKSNKKMLRGNDSKNNVIE